MHTPSDEVAARIRSKDRVAVFAADISKRVRRLHTVRAMGMEPRPYGRMPELLGALSAGRRFKLVLAVVDGCGVEASRHAAALLAAAQPHTPILFLWDRAANDASIVPPESDFLIAPFTEAELRVQITRSHRSLCTPAANEAGGMRECEMALSRMRSHELAL